MDANEEKHLERLQALREQVGPKDPKPHTGGYLSQNQYATMVYYWAAEEHPMEEVDGVIATLANCGWARVPGRELGLAGAISALVALYPEQAMRWSHSYPQLFQRVAEHAKSIPAEDKRWNDFHIAEWFLLRKARRDDGVEVIDKLLDRIAEGGTIGYDARTNMQAVAEQCKPFEIAWRRAEAERRGRMIIQ